MCVYENCGRQRCKISSNIGPFDLEGRRHNHGPQCARGGDSRFGARAPERNLRMTNEVNFEQTLPI